MDRYIVREPRAANVYSHNNKNVGFSVHTATAPENVYTGANDMEYPGFLGMTYVKVNQNQFPHVHNLVPNQSAVMPGPESGIDARYLQQYADNNAAFITGHPRPQVSTMNAVHAPMQSNNPMFYREMREVPGTHPSFNRTGVIQHATGLDDGLQQYREQNNETFNNNEYFSHRKPNVFEHSKNTTFQSLPDSGSRAPYPTVHPKRSGEKTSSSNEPLHKTINAPSPSPQQFVFELDSLKNEVQNPTKTRFDKLRARTNNLQNTVSTLFEHKHIFFCKNALHKSGPRVFSGPVEKVLKWHRSLQDIGLLVLYEIVAKFVSVRPGESHAKNLVIRDENGPAMQVVYYEIDFLLPELRPSSTVRIVGRMMPGTCRLQAFSVRPATGDDVAMSQRRAAVATHHVTKLCKEYSVKPNNV